MPRPGPPFGGPGFSHPDLEDPMRICLVLAAGIGLATGAATAGESRLDGFGNPDPAVAADGLATVKPVVLEAKGKGKGKG